MTIDEMLKKLDPHSVYIPKSDLASVQETMNGNFTGIGIQFRMIRDSVTVINVIDGGPSAKAGLKAGDRILKADTVTLFGKNYDSEKIMEYFKSNKPDPIKLSVYRKQENKILNFNFNRGNVNIKSIPVYYMVNNSIGFIKLEIFSRTTFNEFHKALNELKKQGMQSLILDLRNNTGGYLDIANEIMDDFLPDGNLMVYTKSKSGKVSMSFATKKGDFETGNVYVLINEESASASEIVAGSIQDNDRGTIVGRRSFGKGLVQQEMDLGDGSAVRLTTARYYTPTGRSIQKPYDQGNEDYFYDSEMRATNGELLYKDSIPIVDSLKYKTPKGKIVYGGGGIIPDVFVPIDTTFFVHGFQIGLLSEMIFDYADNNRQKYSNMSFDQFNKEFDVQVILDIYYTNKKEGFHNSKTTLNQLKWYIKAMLARELYGEEAFYRIYQEHDLMIQEVLKIENKT
jgi:carboxyl-terminal processing protease